MKVKNVVDRVKKLEREYVNLVICNRLVEVIEKKEELESLLQTEIKFVDSGDDRSGGL